MDDERQVTRRQALVLGGAMTGAALASVTGAAAEVVGTRTAAGRPALVGEPGYAERIRELFEHGTER